MIGSFDRLGYERHRRRFRAADLDFRLDGRVCLVTCANSGIGRATSRALAARGARVVLLCRDPGRGEEARDAIRRETGNPLVDLCLLDVSDLGALQVPRRSSWLTLGVGVALLGLLGTGERADLLAHLLGFAVGVTEGLAVRRMTRSSRDPLGHRPGPRAAHPPRRLAHANDPTSGRALRGNPTAPWRWLPLSARGLILGGTRHETRQ